MKAYPIPSKHMTAAMDAHTNLTIYEAVVAILEGGTLSGDRGTAAARIIAICRKEQQRQLKLMDKAVQAQSSAKRSETGGAA